MENMKKSNENSSLYRIEKDPIRTIAIAVQHSGQSDEAFHASIDELEQLAQSVGYHVISRITQKRSRPAPTTFIGTGKLNGVAKLTGGPGVDTSGSDAILDMEDDDFAGDEANAQIVGDLVVVNDTLTPRQLRILEKALGVPVVDRTGIILKIFEDRAQTRVAKLEVEIARLNYELPRQRDNMWKNDRQGGGGRGEKGHTVAELNKMNIRDRIAQLQVELNAEEVRSTLRRQLRHDVYRVSLVGYTNAGKSSLMRALSNSDVLVEDKLFATLGTTVRQLDPPATPPIIITDTVGFIRDLPHELVASFRSTLDEAVDSQLILLVIDASDPAWPVHAEVTRETLAAIEAHNIPTWTVFNKVDQLDDESRQLLSDQYPDALFCSAIDTDAVRQLRDNIIDIRDHGLNLATLLVPYKDGQILGDIYRNATVLSESHTSQGTVLTILGEQSFIDKCTVQLNESDANTDTESVNRDDIDYLLMRAQDLGLDIDSHDEGFNDSGLDYRTLRAVTTDGAKWLLKEPRRLNVYQESGNEDRGLRLIRDKVSVEVPDWQIRHPNLIAYPLLAGTPGWTINAQGRPDWHIISPDNLPDSFMESMAEFLVQLQRIPYELAYAADLRAVSSMDEIKQKRRALIESTKGVLQPSKEILDRWIRWLENDALWPTHLAFAHSDLHPGHLLLHDNGQLRGVLDWSELQVGDPARDLSLFFGCFGRDALLNFINAFAKAGGHVWDGMADYIEELWSFYAVEIAAWGITHNNPDVIAHAREHLSLIINDLLSD